MFAGGMPHFDCSIFGAIEAFLENLKYFAETDVGDIIIFEVSVIIQMVII